jgi:NAD(P)-dependent dehydrogenase (short-subunit alcohol dehydrogenase family)
MTIAKSLGVALVTGAAQGIGKAIAMRLASDGFKVALNDVKNKKEQLEAVAHDIEKQGQASFVVPADVSQEREVHEMVQSASKTLGGLDVVSKNVLLYCS